MSQAMDDPAYPRIGSLAAVGDGHSVALMGPDGAIEWFCPLRFDAPPMVWPLLDRRRGGRIRVGPRDVSRTTCQYIDRTAVLEYDWETSSGRATVTVCMAWEVDPARQELIWLVDCDQGEVDLEAVFDPAPGFGRDRFEIDVGERRATVRTANITTTFSAPFAFEAGPKGTRAGGVLRAGDQVGFRLEVQDLASPAQHPHDLPDAAAVVDETIAGWHEWASIIQYDGPYADAVMRSALTLRLLIYEPSGAVVAAPTTSLPEVIGGARNWDYRYTWLRDASFTLNALYQLGCKREARRYARWMCWATAQHGIPLRVFYGIDGEAEFPESQIEEADGYRASRPVRVGNAAEHQFQLDSYGELLDCIAICEVMGDDVMRDEWPHFRNMVDFVAEHWREPDSGIWEVRDAARHFVHSKAMAWVALNRGAAIANALGLEADVDRWSQEASAVVAQILREGVVEDGGYLGRAYGETATDASLLMLPIVGVLEGVDRIMQATMDAIVEQLNPPGAEFRGLLLRYPHHAGDGLPGKEGAFAICSFWLVEALALAGRRAEAEDVFEGMLALGGDVGLFAEEIDPSTGEQLGNFPQAFTHIGLINAALRLAERTAKSTAVSLRPTPVARADEGANQ